MLYTEDKDSLCRIVEIKNQTSFEYPFLAHPSSAQKEPLVVSVRHLGGTIPCVWTLSSTFRFLSCGWGASSSSLAPHSLIGNMDTHSFLIPS